MSDAPARISCSGDEKLVVSASVGSLYPILPQHTGRYNVAERVTRSHAVVGAGMFMATRTPVPMYLPKQWSAHTHPEGQVYFLRDSDNIKVVTDAYMYESEVAEKILSWVAIIEKELIEKSIFTFPNTVELYVQLEDEDCNYYFVDHNSRTLFWLDDYNTTDLGLLPVVSPSHLKLQLEEHYWTHVEYHCMHAIPFTTPIVEEVISQLIHACGDQMTSSSSTFPYSFQESKNFLDILTPARQGTPSGHVITTVARILNVIAHNRYWTHYGQKQARLSRDTSIINDRTAIAQITWPSTISSALTFRTSDFYESKLDTVFTDNFVYAADWQKFVKVSQGKWRNAFLQSLALLVLHVFCFFVPVGQGLAVVSSGLLASSMFVSAILMHQHQDMEEGTATDAYAYLSRNMSEKFRFQALALFFSLPQAFSLWGMILTFSQAALFVQPIHLYIVCLATALLGSMFLVSKAFLSGRPSSLSTSSVAAADVAVSEKESVNKSIV